MGAPQRCALHRLSPGFRVAFPAHGHGRAVRAAGLPRSDARPLVRLVRLRHALCARRGAGGGLLLPCPDAATREQRAPGSGLSLCRQDRCTAPVRLARAAGHRDRRPRAHVGVVESGAMNAFACGASRNFSVAVFTRGAIDGLDDDELSAVIAHELIHIRNGDTRLIAAANVFLRGLGLLDRVNLFKPRRYRQVAVVLFAPILFPVYLGVGLLAQFLKRLGYASRLLISSAREFIADAEAVTLTQNPSALVSALRKIQGNSAIVGLLPEQDAMMIDGAAQGALASHPMIGERIQAIVAATGAMALETRPRRDTRTDFERRRGEAGAVSSDSAALGPNQVRTLVRTALTRAAPEQSGV